VNIFASIKVEMRFKKVVFYGVQMEGESESLFLQFIKKHAKESKYRDDLDVLRTWLKKLGNEQGAKAWFFRNERAVLGLPPKQKYLETSCRIRLYCLRFNDRAVMLFGGGVKTTARAQDCPFVGPAFKRANQLGRAVDKAMKAKELCIDPEDGKLRFDANFKLYL